MRIGSPFGIEVRLDISVILIFLLIVWSLAGGLFPDWHPDWSPALRWGTALAAGLLFFTSLLAHEFSHSVVAQAYGIPVPRITLFLLGGVSELSSDPRTPKTEFLMAIAGPLMSLALGIGFLLIGLQVAGEAFAGQLAEDRTAALASLSPLATMLLWLGPVNLMLAIFNMVPGSPLDGGRVLRALLWWIGGDRLRATRWASDAGRLFGWSLIALGVLSLVSGQGLGGLWLVLIGWFLSTAAGQSYTRVWLEQSLRRLQVADLMRTRFGSTTPDTPLARFIDDQLLRSQQLLWPVQDEAGLVGWIGQEDVAELGESDRQRRYVRDLMRAPGSAPTLAPDTPADQAFDQLSTSPDRPLAVLDGERMVGLLASADVMRWLALHGRGH
ncbi:MAG: site-2 protease family protein [Gammaproteobacteria bacterium]|nr:site-2 protease family protein [Gammaproteobacteria bacterium]